MVGNSTGQRGPGRPRTFDVDRAVDAAVDAFWTHGYEGADVSGIARAAGTTKPSLYQLFGDKRQLFLKALSRYGETIGAKPIQAFIQANTLEEAVRSFLGVAVLGHTAEEGPKGCLLACVAAPCASSDAAVEAIYRAGLTFAQTTMEQRFANAIADGELDASLPAPSRAALLIDLMQGLAVRARAGATREVLLAQADDYVRAVLVGLRPKKSIRSDPNVSGASSGT